MCRGLHRTPWRSRLRSRSPHPLATHGPSSASVRALSALVRALLSGSSVLGFPPVNGRSVFEERRLEGMVSGVDAGLALPCLGAVFARVGTRLRSGRTVVWSAGPPE